MQSRRIFLACSTLGAALAQQKRSNVLVVMSDQETALPPGPVNLPARRRIQANGVMFTNAFCNTPQCSAARSALLTGLEPNRTGVLTNVDGASRGKPLPTSLATIGNLFRSAGYSTGYFGKWHLGARGPENFGFGAQAGGKDDAVARNAAEWIRAQRGPWLAWVSFLNPHHIYNPPAKGYRAVAKRPGVGAPFSGLKALEGKPAEQYEFSSKQTESNKFTAEDWIHYRSHYCNLMEEVDRCTGTVLDAVQDLDSTIVAYTSDHGDALGEHGLPFKGPFMYDELIRIPFCIAGPKSLIGRGERDDLVTQTDLLPTLAALAGVKAPANLSGFDLSTKRNTRDAVLLEYVGQQQRIYPIRTIRTRQWKLNWYDSGAKELYNLSADPHEIRNLAGDSRVRDVQAGLEKRLQAWRPSITELERKTPGRFLVAAKP